MKYMKNTLHTELYRLAWDYATGKCSWETVKYMREAILTRYKVTHKEMMQVWRQKYRSAYQTINGTAYQKGNIMEFLLVWDWVDEEFGWNYQQLVDSFATKEELLEAYKKAREEYREMVAIGRLILSPAIGYSWADLERLFQSSLTGGYSKEQPPRLRAQGLGMKTRRVNHYALVKDQSGMCIKYEDNKS